VPAAPECYTEKAWCAAQGFLAANRSKKVIVLNHKGSSCVKRREYSGGTAWLCLILHTILALFSQGFFYY